MSFGYILRIIYYLNNPSAELLRPLHHFMQTILAWNAFFLADQAVIGIQLNDYKESFCPDTGF